MSKTIYMKYKDSAQCSLSEISTFITDEKHMASILLVTCCGGKPVWWRHRSYSSVDVVSVCYIVVTISADIAS